MSMRLTHGPAAKAIREALGIKASHFATAIGVSTGHLSNIESGTRQPSEAVTTKMAERLGVSKDAITYVVSGEAKTSKASRAA